MKQLIDKLEATNNLTLEEWTTLIQGRTPSLSDYLFKKARQIRDVHYGKEIYLRGLIEFTNHCQNNCIYCGIRCAHSTLKRYRLTAEEILDCCRQGYALGFRTFVLQGGEDPFFTDDHLIPILSEIKDHFPDCALTLSIGERSEDSYRRLYQAGADRYLLRHETADPDHYRKLHPPSLTAKHRQACLWQLKAIGYEVGTGFMVGSPFQTPHHLARDMQLIKKLNPQMVGIGPFIPHHRTPFRNESAGSLELTLFMLGLLRLMLPTVLLPATTALSTLSPKGRILGIQAGANVIMPNLSPSRCRKDYDLYDGKVSLGAESAEGLNLLKQQLSTIGHRIAITRGDSKTPKVS